MHGFRWVGVFLVAVLVLLSLGGGPAIWAAPHRQDQVLAEIEPGLVAALEAEGQANLFVVFHAQPDLSPAYSMPWEERGEFVYQALRRTAQQSQAQLRAWLDARRIPYRSFFIDNSIYVAGADLALANEMAAFAGVSQLRLERLWPVPEPIQVDEEPVAPEATTDWGIGDMNADDVWALGYQGAGIKVANIDTGVQYNHPALDQSFACPGQPTNPACWYDPGNYCGAGGACDNNGHGTHTMGTMVGDDDPSLTYIAGVAPDATWIACKGCGTNSCSDSDLNACADWVLAPGGSTANRPNVLNNSWGGGGGDSWYLSKVNAWRAAGIFPAFSAGNEGSGCSTLGSPGDYQESFASAAHSSSRTIASFSSRGPSVYGHSPYTKPNISAPGVNICSSIPTNGWSCSYSGTSMASPHTAGAVALIWQACPSYQGSIDATFQLLQNYADAPPAGNCSAPPDGEGNYTYGYGYLNVLAAVNACSGGPPPTPTNTPTPSPPAPILLVDDDNGSAYEGYFVAALIALGKGYDLWTVQSQGSPSAATLQQYDVVIWFTGNDWSTTLTSTDEANLATYLDGGGRLFITGQDIGYDIYGDSFYGSYLHASYVRDDTNTYGLTGYDIVSGANVTISGGDGANNQSYPSEIGLGSGAVGLYDYDGSYTWGGLRWEGAYKVVYFSFGYEAINSTASRTTVMDKVLTWLEGGAPPPTPTNTPAPPTPTNTPPAPPTPTNTPPPPPTPTPTPPPGGDVVWLSLTGSATLPNVGTIRDEDIVALDLATGAYSWIFDGSDVGVTTDVDAFDLLANGSILISFDNNTSVPGVGTVADADIVEFIPTALGATTSGTFTFFFDGSDVGLTTTSEDIDGIFLLSDGTLLVSTRGSISAPGVSAADEDLVQFTPASWGSSTSGTWSYYFDGSDVGLSSSSSEDVDGLWVDEAEAPYPDIYLSTVGNFAVSGASGADEDLFIFHPTSLGSGTGGSFGPGLYVDGSLYGLASPDVDGFDVQR